MLTDWVVIITIIFAKLDSHVCINSGKTENINRQYYVRVVVLKSLLSVPSKKSSDKHKRETERLNASDGLTRDTIILNREEREMAAREREKRERKEWMKERFGLPIFYYVHVC